MPLARDWTQAQDDTIISMRAAGETWKVIGLALGLSRNTVIERGRRLNAQAAPVTPAAPEPDDRAVGPVGALPAGHPTTWGLISDREFPRY
jgi:hypothetical protein